MATHYFAYLANYFSGHQFSQHQYVDYSRLLVPELTFTTLTYAWRT
jgi:hypothetical protein